VRLTADHLFTTRFAAGGATKDGVLDGPLVVTAGGDPCLSSRAGGYPPASLFARLAASLEEHGIRKVAGGLVALLADYPLPHRPATWPQDQLGFAYAAPSAGLVLQEGCLDLTIDPTSGDAATLRFEPAGLPLAVRGRIAVTDDRKAGGRYGAALAGDTVRLWGAYWRRAGPAVARLPVPDPELVFLQALRSALVGHGVDVAGEDVVLRTRAEPPPPDATLFVQKTPIAPALRAALTDSSNFHAEMLLRALGRAGGGDGSLADGCRALTAFLARHRAGPGESVVADGSGLSKDNRVSPRIVAAVLGDALAAGDDGHVLVSSLAVGGASGTLADRFTEPSATGRVRAKTGWVRGASSLSGIADARSGRRYVFSILMNYDPDRNGFNRELKEWQDRIVNLLLDW
jgi:D-alanyl-D-alanine carboxypeptidase/D-alanyl-D-alanine-endopeptidase (penicillin-binding protein 4)